MEYSGVFSPTYDAARDGFRRAAKELGVTPAPFSISKQGSDGEELTIDVAFVGAVQPGRAVVVSSGLHGVEGFLGSAIQTSWLRNLARSGEQLPDRTAVVLLHALNPYGFAWRRRVNENNVDLNRNFLLSDDSYFGVSPEARKFNWFINPASLPGRFSLFLPQAAILILRYGMQPLKAALTQGQYEFEKGLFFGGKRPETTTALVQEYFTSWVRQTPRVLHLDFHSGLGRFAECRLLSVEPTDSPCARWLAARFLPGRVEAIGAGVAARTTARGSMGHWLTAELRSRGQNYAFLSPEFATYSGLRVFKALREENRVDPHPQHPAYEKIKRRFAEVFCPESVVWRSTVVKQGLDLIRQAVQVCQDEVWEVP